MAFDFIYINSLNIFLLIKHTTVKNPAKTPPNTIPLAFPIFLSATIKWVGYLVIWSLEFGVWIFGYLVIGLSAFSKF
jgi:hypothetical protein